MINKERWVKKNVLKHPVHLLALGFGSGLAPKAPGTWGTLAAVPIFYWILSPLSWPVYVLVVSLLVVVSCWICDVTARDIGGEDADPKCIVLDEMVGYWIALIALPATWYYMIAAFIWFRLFDIWKPWPVSWVDEKVKGGIGIVLDDVLAGIMAWGTIWLTTYLGVLVLGSGIFS